jgi:hypothetical protein
VTARSGTGGEAAPGLSAGKERRRVGDHLDAAPRSAWSGRIVIAKPFILPAGGQRNVSRGAGAYLAVGSPPISAPAPSLQGDPEERPH